MVTIHKIFPYGFAANTYLVTADNKSAVAIDPSQLRVLDEAKRLGLTIEAVLLTHGHFDHTGACNTLFQSGVPIYCSEAEKDLVCGEDSLYRDHSSPIPLFKPRAVLKDGDKITLCGITFKVISTPGHTVGGVTYQVGDNLFTGDTLFRGCVGRSDLPTGNEEELIRSVKKLYALEGNYNVYPGHSEDSTTDFEKKYNMCVRG